MATARTEGLSSDLVVAREIASMEKRGVIPHFERLSEALSKSLSVDDLSQAIDSLFDQAMIKTDWQKDPSDGWVRSYHISNEARDFVEFVYNRTAA